MRGNKHWQQKARAAGDEEKEIETSSQQRGPFGRAKRSRSESQKPCRQTFNFPTFDKFGLLAGQRVFYGFVQLFGDVAVGVEAADGFAHEVALFVQDHQ